VYDRLYAEFQNQLVEEYSNMKEAYIQDFKNNF
jgi:hypothetical protein